MRRGTWVTLILFALVATAAVTLPASTDGADAATPSAGAAVTVPKSAVVQSPTYSVDTVNAVRSEADWIATAQMPDGAIAHYTDRVKIWPYLSNYAAVGLARATEVTGNGTYAKDAWRWLAWYQGREASTGFVTDYNIVGGVPVSTGDMDSTDAYAGTYLLAVWSAFHADHNKAQLSALRPGINGAVRAIAATTDTDGLTWAKPAWHVKYLMDEAEAYSGLRAATRLYSALGATSASKNVSLRASHLKAGVDGLWNASLASYDWALHGDGARQTTDWSVLYPHTLEQQWAVAFGLTDAGRSVALTEHLTAAHPLWSVPTSTGQPDATDYWPVAGWAEAHAGETDLAASAATTLRGAAQSVSRAWPYTPAVAGQLIVLLTGGPTLP